jgi:hypothetical protein
LRSNDKIVSKIEEGNEMGKEKAKQNREKQGKAKI